MLNLVRITLYHFMLHTYSVIDTTEQSIFIEGRNYDSGMDSNGSGKSQIPDALTWCLFDEVIREMENKDAIIGLNSKWAGVGTRWWDDVDNAEYQVIRTRNHPVLGSSTLFLKDDGGRYDLDLRDLKAGDLDNLTGNLTLRTPTMTQSRIENWLGMNFNVFRNTVLSAQKDMDKFLYMSPEERKVFMVQARGLDVLNVTADLIKKDLKDKKDKLLDAETDGKMLESGIAKIEESIKSFKNDIANLTDTSPEQERLIGEIARLEKQITQVQEDAENKAKEIYESLGPKESRRDELKAKIEKLTPLTEEARKTGLQLVKVDTEISAKNNEIRQLRSEADKLKKMEGGVCPVCRQPVLPENVGKCIAESEDKINKLTTEKGNLDGESAGLKSQKDSLESQVKDLPGFTKELSRLEIEISNLGKDADVALERADNQVESNQAKIKNLRQEIKNLGSQKDYLLEKLQSEEDRLLKENGKLKKSREKHAILKKEIQPLEYWFQSFSRDLQIEIIDSDCRNLEESANEYLNRLGSGLQFSYLIKTFRGKDSFFVKTVDQAGRITPPLGRSGGEQARLGIAEDLAFKTLSESRINLSIIDEAFDGLDGPGVSTALDLFSGLSAQGRKIICISHNQKARGYFHKIITVERRNGEARII